MAKVIQPLRSESSKSPALEVAIQDALVAALKAKFESAEHLMAHIHQRSGSQLATASASKDPVTENQVHDLIVLLARITQFDMGLPGAWTPSFKQTIEPFLARIVGRVMGEESRSIGTYFLCS